ncbi:MAG: ankyrin repeat domain-containing protein [Pseudomonadota bacterium]
MGLRWLSSLFGVIAAGFPAAADVAFSDLYLAAIRGEAEKVEAILLWGADPNEPGWLGLTPLSAAMRSCAATPEVVYALTKGGADIEARSGAGATPLMLAWQMGRPDLAEMLLALGADPKARNMYGDTAEEYALYFSGQLPDEAFATLRFTSLGLVRKSGDGSEMCGPA